MVLAAQLKLLPDGFRDQAGMGRFGPRCAVPE
jgi:hypothetical protein